MKYKLQPLKMPSGWYVAYYSGFCEIDHSSVDNSIDDMIYFKEDLLQLVHQQANRLLDLGWYGDLQTGSYHVQMYEHNYLGKLLYEYQTTNLQQALVEIERVLQQVSNGNLYDSQK